MSNQSKANLSWTRIPRPSTEVHSSNVPLEPLTLPQTGKRDRADNEDEAMAAADFNNNEAARASKKLRTSGPNLVAFYKPFPCAFFGCRFRTTCSYHHGVAVVCYCDSVACPKGHPHRRAPQACDHGSPSQCRWNMLGECSFHHGDPTTCDCSDLTCEKAHMQRTVLQTDLRKEQKPSKPSHGKNTQKLYVRFLFRNKNVSNTELHELIRVAVAIAMDRDPLDENNDNPIEEVIVCEGKRHAFLLFHSAAMATACLALDGLYFPGKGRIQISRPRGYQPALSIKEEAWAHVELDTSQLDIVPQTRKKDKKKKANRKSDTAETSARRMIAQNLYNQMKRPPKQQHSYERHSFVKRQSRERPL